MGTDPNCTWNNSNSRLIKHVQLGSVPICIFLFCREESSREVALTGVGQENEYVLAGEFGT